MNVFDAKVLMSDITASKRKLSNWEISFLNSIDKQLERGFKLSDKQGSCLQKIYRKAYGGTN